MSLKYKVLSFFLVFNFSLSGFGASAENSDKLSDFFLNHTAVEMRKYCNEEESTCRSIVYYSNNQTGELVHSFQISFVRTVEGKEANATELFIYDDYVFMKYFNKSDEAAIMELNQAQPFTAENQAGDLASVIREESGDVYIIDFIEQGHDIEFRESEVNVYSPEDELIEALTLPLVH